MGHRAPLELISTDLQDTGKPQQTKEERSWLLNTGAQEEQAPTQPMLQNQVVSLHGGSPEIILTHHCFSCAWKSLGLAFSNCQYFVLTNAFKICLNLRK